MGKNSREIRKTLKGVGNLDYVEVKHVPMKSYAGYGDSVDAHVLAEIEKQVARFLINERVHARGLEVEYFRNIFGLSQRDFAQKLGLSHVAILKWEKAKHKPLDLVNEVAVKALVAGMLGLKLPASIEALSGEGEFPKKIVLEYSTSGVKSKKTQLDGVENT